MCGVQGFHPDVGKTACPVTALILMTHPIELDQALGAVNTHLETQEWGGQGLSHFCFRWV